MGELSQAEAEKIEGNVENFCYDLGLSELEPIWEQTVLDSVLDL